MRAKLVVVGGDTKTKEVELRMPAVLGRGREATLTLPHPLVSRQHCEITEAEGRLIVKDLGSLNGTFVANERIEECVLEHGQLLTVGTVTFRAVYLDDTAAPIAPNVDTVPEATQMNETVPVPVADPAPAPDDIPMAAPAEPEKAADAPQASPVEEDVEEDDDLSAFFDSLK